MIENFKNIIPSIPISSLFLIFSFVSDSLNYQNSTYFSNWKLKNVEYLSKPGLVK